MGIRSSSSSLAKMPKSVLIDTELGYTPTRASLHKVAHDLARSKNVVNRETD
jgi:hypothetical protein